MFIPPSVMIFFFKVMFGFFPYTLAIIVRVLASHIAFSFDPNFLCDLIPSEETHHVLLFLILLMCLISMKKHTKAKARNVTTQGSIE